MTDDTCMTWDDKTIKCVFLGYDETIEEYWIYNPKTKFTWTSKNAHFDETCFPLAPPIVTSNHELDSEAIAWPGDNLPKPHEPLSNPSILTHHNDNPSNDPTENSNSHFPPHASKLSEQVQDLGLCISIWSRRPVSRLDSHFLGRHSSCLLPYSPYLS